MVKGNGFICSWILFGKWNSIVIKLAYKFHLNLKSYCANYFLKRSILYIYISIIEYYRRRHIDDYKYINFEGFSVNLESSGFQYVYTCTKYVTQNIDKKFYNFFRKFITIDDRYSDITDLFRYAILTKPRVAGRVSRRFKELHYKKSKKIYS